MTRTTRGDAVNTKTEALALSMRIYDLRNEPMTVVVHCGQPSAYLVARKNGGRCGKTLRAKSLTEAVGALYAHILSEHDGRHDEATR